MSRARDAQLAWAKLHLVPVPQTLHLIPTRRRHEPNTAPLPATERAPPRASGSAYGCSTTKALAGEGPIAVPHTAARDDLQERRSTARRLLLRPGGAGVRGGRSGAFGPRPTRQPPSRPSTRSLRWESEGSARATSGVRGDASLSPTAWRPRSLKRRSFIRWLQLSVVGRRAAMPGRFRAGLDSAGWTISPLARRERRHRHGRGRQALSARLHGLRRAPR